MEGGGEEWELTKKERRETEEGRMKDEGRGEKENGG